MVRSILTALCLSGFLSATSASACIDAPSTISFQRGRATLTADGRQSLRALADKLRKSNTAEIICVSILNPDALESRLRIARIATIKRGFIEAGVAPARIKFIGVPTKGGTLNGNDVGRAPWFAAEISTGCY